MRCAVRGEIGVALRQLLHDREAGTVPPFERIVVETTGLAEPVDLVGNLGGIPVQGMVAAIDAVDGARALDERTPAYAQAIAADALVLTKSDLAPDGAADALRARLSRLNPDAQILRAPQGYVDPVAAWSAAAAAPGREVRRMQSALAQLRGEAPGALCVRFAHPLELSGFCLRLAAFLEDHAGKVLRVKGLVRVAGRHGPAVIQAVGTTLYPVRTLKEWPPGVGESALVVVARGIADDTLRVGVERAGAAASNTPAR
jgi:G3E family GTPase